MRLLIFTSRFTGKPLPGALFLFFGFCCGAHAAEVIDRVVALVNGDMIALHELNERMAPFAARIQKSDYPLARQRSLLFKLREEKLKELINEKLADQEIERLGIDVPESEVDAAVERFKKGNRLNGQSLQESLLRQGIPYETFRDRIRKQLLRAFLVDREVRTRIVVTDEEIDRYYRTHIEDFGGEAKYHLKNILKGIAPGTPAEQKLILFRELQALRQSIETTEDFEAAAKVHSDAPNSREGGEIGAVAPESLSGPIREAVAKLKPGEVSAVIETDRGYQIFLLVDFAQSAGKSPEPVREQISAKLYREQVDRAYSKWLNKLYESAYIRRLP